MTEINENSPDKPQSGEKHKSLGKRIRSALKEISKPFVDLIHAPRALWGINLAYFIEGIAYWGVLGYLSIHFTELIFQGIEPEETRVSYAHNMVMVLTAGITIAMFFLGTVADKRGIRFALISAFILMIIGRGLISSAPSVLGLQPTGMMWSPLHLVTMGGIVFVVIGYGMYQPAAYAAVRKFTTPKTAAMGFAMLYALMNLGGGVVSFGFLLRDDNFAGFGITGTYWVYTFLTVLALIATVVLLTRQTVKSAVATAKEETERLKADDAESRESQQATEEDEQPSAVTQAKASRRIPIHLWGFVFALLVALYLTVPEPWNYIVTVTVLLGWIASAVIAPTARWLARHPLADAKFFFFIFALIPVQTLFTYVWLVMPQYIKYAYEGWIGEYFEIASNANPYLIFIAVPIITAITQKAKVYNMMILGTFVMAAPAFLLALGPSPWTLFPYIVIMAIGEAMWQPRFLQYAAEIAPEGRTGEYMGVAQLPWFLTKVLVPWLYSGWMLGRYCPAQGPKNTEFMWFVFACIAMCSTVLLVLARNWLGKDFKTKAD